MKKLIAIFIASVMIFTPVIIAQAQIASQFDINLRKLVDDHRPDNQYYVGEVLWVEMTANFLTPVQSTVASTNGSRVLSPVWGPSTTDGSGNWIGYLLPFQPGDIGDWVLTVKTSSGTKTKPFTVVTNPATFNVWVSSQFAEVGGLIGNLIITGAQPNKVVEYTYYRTPLMLDDARTSATYDIGTTDSQGNFQISIPARSYYWRAEDMGYWIVQAKIEGQFKQAAFEVWPNMSRDPSTHAPGTNVKGPDGTVYFITENYTRRPYTSAGAFLSYKFNGWLYVEPASEADMALPLDSDFISPRQGALINDKGTVYIITSNVRQGFASEKAFRELGYSFNNVYPGDTSFMTAINPINSSARPHPDGTVINDKGTLYFIWSGWRVGIPNMAVFDSWGYWLSEVVPANSHDRDLPLAGTAGMRPTAQLDLDLSKSR
jgi:hypothetical protein